MQEAIRSAQLLITYLHLMRKEIKFDSFCSGVIHDCVGLTAEPTLPRQRIDPKDLMIVQAPTHMKLPNCHINFEVVELTAGKVERRFIQKNLGIINDIESTLIEFANGNTKKSILAHLEMYLKDDFELERLKIQLSMLLDVIKTSSLCTNYCKCNKQKCNIQRDAPGS